MCRTKLTPADFDTLSPVLQQEVCEFVAAHYALGERFMFNGDFLVRREEAGVSFAYPLHGEAVVERVVDNRVYLRTMFGHEVWVSFTYLVTPVGRFVVPVAEEVEG